MKELDVVRLTQNLPEEGLRAGETGAVVVAGKYGDREVYDVEFCFPDGRTKAIVTLGPSLVQLVSDEY